MAETGASSYLGGATTGGFWAGLIGGLGDLLKSPIYPAQPTRPNPNSQVLISRNSTFVADGGAPATPFHPAGYASADLWFNPYDPVTKEQRFQDNWVWDNTRGKFVNQPIPNTIVTPKFYAVKSEIQYDMQPPSAAEATQIFKSPEASVINQGPCDPTPANVAQTVRDRINRLVQNQFFSPFRARRYGGNSYQAISEAADDIFDPTGKPGVFTPEVVPAILARQRQERLFRG